MPAASTSLVLADSATQPLRASRVISNREQGIVDDILREFSQYTSARSTTAGHCEEVAQLILPTSRNTFYYQNYNTPGAKKTQQQIDATGALALHRFCGIADSLVTPRNEPWHALAGDDYVMKDRASRLYLERTNNILFKERYEANANFSSQNYNNWQSIGAFGNATMFIDRFDNRWHHGTRGLRYKAVPFGETFYGENHQGKVDRIIRWFRLTAYQAVQKFGRDQLPEALVAPLNQHSPWGYNFLHCVRPRGDGYDPEAWDERRLPFESWYVSIEGRCLMAPPSGYRTFPYAVSRYDQTPGEVYGRGPAMIALPSLKTLNAQKSVFLKQGHRASDPVLLVADDGAVGMNLRPGAINPGTMNQDGKPLVGVLPSGDIAINEKMMEEERRIIDDIFLVSIFKPLVENPNMTATQVIELVNERGMLVAPTLGRQFTEYVGGMVPRELDLLSEQGLLEPMPPRLREAMGVYEVVDSSPLAKAAKMSKPAGFFRSVEGVREVVNVTGDPSHLDVFDFDTALPEIARLQSVPESWMSDPKQIAEKRRARQQAQQQKAQIDAMPAQAAMIKASAVQAQKAPQMLPGPVQ
jgi:hypothetical protein